MYRVQITGPRDCSATSVIHSVLAGLYVVHGSGLVIVTGMAKGVDQICDRWAVGVGLKPERHPADWGGPCDFESSLCQPGHRRVNKLGRDYCPTAGLRRNETMAISGPDEGIAFIHKPLIQCRGTKDMVLRMERHGVSHRVISTVCGEQHFFDHDHTHNDPCALSAYYYHGNPNAQPQLS